MRPVLSPLAVNLNISKLEGVEDITVTDITVTDITVLAQLCAEVIT